MTAERFHPSLMLLVFLDSRSDVQYACVDSRLTAIVSRTVVAPLTVRNIHPAPTA